MQKNRDLSYDIARAIAILWVVGFWHLAGSYETHFDILHMPIGQPITDAMMGCFMFISGHFLQRYTVSSLGDALNFYRKRLSRFYLMFLFSALTIYLGGKFMPNQMFESLQQLVLTMAGLTTLFPPHAGQFWFISMLMLFYLLTPVIQIGGGNKKVVSSMAIFVFFVLWRLVMGEIGETVYVFFPIFSLGLITPSASIDAIKKKHLILPLLCMLWYALFRLELYLHTSMMIIRLSSIFLSVAVGVLILLCLADLLARIKNGSFIWLMYSISYLSMSAYFFHRQIYSVTKMGLVKIFGDLDSWMIYLVILPVTLFVSYLIQKVFDYFLSQKKV